MIVLNNKCNLEKDEFINYLKSLETINHELILCPSTINIPEFNSNKILLGAQNVSKAEDGPHTGEVSAKQLSSYGVKYCIIGHSERRIKLSYFSYSFNSSQFYVQRATFKINLHNLEVTRFSWGKSQTLSHFVQLKGFTETALICLDGLSKDKCPNSCCDPCLRAEF